MGNNGARYNAGRTMGASRLRKGGIVKHFRWLICLLAVLALVAAACGGNDDDDSDAATLAAAPTEASDSMDDGLGDDSIDDDMGDDSIDDDMGE